MHEFKFWPLILPSIAFAGMALGFALSKATSGRADSVDSHTVNNYLETSGASQALKDRFNSVNSDWPPSRASLGLILLDAKRRQVKGNISTTNK